jgi:hypothetical protein
MKHTLHNLLGFAPQIVWGGGSTGGGGGGDRPSTSSRTNSGDRIRVSQPTGGRGSETVMSKPRNSAVDDFLMDIGAKPRNDVYYRDLVDRQERSQAAMRQAMSSSDNDSGSFKDTTTDTSTDTDTDTDTTTSTDTTTNLDTDTNTALTNVETISTQTFSDDADFSADVSVGEAEDEALDLMKKGRRATILTKPGGLLGTGTEEGKTRRRRSLIGG